VNVRAEWPPAVWFERFVETIRRQPFFLAALMVLNLWGIVYGFYFYRRQLPETPWYFLPLVPDSPLAVLFISISLLAWRLRGKRSDGWDAFAAGANVKIGAWTVFVLLFHRDLYFTNFPWTPAEQFLLLFGHTGMILEALVLLPRLARSAARLPLARQLGLWLMPLTVFLLNDYVDYTFGQHPHIPARGVDVVERISFGLTFATVVLGAALVWLTQRLLAVAPRSPARTD
jgi:uncharacterized membrane protein YpjA